MSLHHLVLRDDVGAIHGFELTDVPITVGRDPASDIRLEDRSVSRRHARLTPRDGRLFVEDRGSRVGTFLNGARVTGSSEVVPGDWVRLGRCLLLVCHEGDQAHGIEVLHDLAERLGITAREPSAAEGDGDPKSLNPSQVLLTVPALTEPADETASPAHLTLLAEVSKSLQSVTDLEDVLSVLLGFVFDLFGPERGVVLVRDALTGELSPAVVHPEGDGAFVSRTVLDHAVATRSTVVVLDVEEEDRFRQSESIRVQSIRAALCCPMISREELVGVLYLDTRSEGLSARREEIGLLNLIACYAATSIENSQLLAERGRARDLGDLSREPLISRSPAMQQLLGQLSLQAGDRHPLMLEGESGTGKLLAARHVHRDGRGPDAPFLALDCARLSGQDLREVLYEDLPETSAPPRSVPRRASQWNQLRGGTLVLEHAEALDRLSQQVLAERLEAEFDALRGPAADPPPRLIVTIGGSIEALSAGHRLVTDLAVQLRRNTVVLPRIRERKEDIPPLAHHFLRRSCEEKGREPKGFSPEAEQVLERTKFKDTNARGLRDAVELALVLSDGRMIEAEHVFAGPPVRNHRLEFDIAKHPLVEWLIRRRVHESAQMLVAIVFATLVLACLGLANTRVGIVANGLVWGLWWPALLLLFVLIGRVWCTYCPLSRVARWIQALGPKGVKTPSWLKDHAGWVMAGLFVLIIWSEHIFAMPDRPRATGIFLVSLLFLAAAMAVMTQREVWCRYACPLGNLSAGYSVPATMHVHANPAICTSQCRTHECYKGSEAEPGCPMYLHPLYLKDAQFCKLCLSCVRSCPNGSARIWLRPPLQDLWSLAELNPSLVPLAWTVFLIAPVLFAASKSGPSDLHVVPFTLASLLCLTLAWVLARVTARWIDQTGERVASARVAFAMLILAWGPLMAFHLGNIPGIDRWWIREQQDASLHASLISAGVPVLELLQLVVIAAATCAATLALWKVRGGCVEAGSPGRTLGWWVLAMGSAAYLVTTTMMVF